MSLRATLAAFRRQGLHVIYGTSGAGKTAFASTIALALSKSRALYAGLAKHAVLHPGERERLRVVGLPNLERELHFLLSLDVLPEDIDVLVYDGFSAHFLPLRFHMRESSVVRMQLFAATKLHTFAQTRNVPVLVVVQEVSGGKPLAFTVLKSFSVDFTRLERVGENLLVHLMDSNLVEVNLLRIPLSNVLQVYKVAEST